MSAFAGKEAGKTKQLVICGAPDRRRRTFNDFAATTPLC